MVRQCNAQDVNHKQLSDINHKQLRRKRFVVILISVVYSESWRVQTIVEHGL
jgi:hypothetical protein